MVVQGLMVEHGMSQRRACQASGIARSTLRDGPVGRDDSGVITVIQAYMALNPRHGFGLLYDSAHHQGKPWGKTVLWRVYCELRLNLPRRGKKRLPARIKQPLQAAGQPNQGWSCGLVGASGPSTSSTSSAAKACASRSTPACLLLASSGL